MLILAFVVKDQGAEGTMSNERVRASFFAVVHDMTQVYGCNMLVFHSPSHNQEIGWAHMPGTLTGPQAQERERERASKQE